MELRAVRFGFEKIMGQAELPDTVLEPFLRDENIGVLADKKLTREASGDAAGMVGFSQPIQIDAIIVSETAMEIDPRELIV